MSADQLTKKRQPQFHNGPLEEVAQHAARTMTKAARAAIADYLETLRLAELESMVKNSDPVRLHQGQGFCRGLDAAIETIKAEDGYDVKVERQKRRNEGKI